MAAHLSTHMPINLARTVSDKSWQILGLAEGITQTFLPGTPVEFSGGYIIAWDGSTVAAGIAGIALNGGSNLASAGLGAPTNAFSGIGAPGATPLFTDKIPNQSAAVSIPHGAKVVDGRNLIAIADANSIFEAQVDNNSGSSFTLAQTNIGVAYGLSKDTNGSWYVDLAKTGGSACLVIVGQNTIDGFIANARVYFKFLAASIQILA